VQRSLPLLVVACLAAPETGRAQTGIASAPLPAPPPPPIQLFKESAPEPGGTSIELLKSSSWWEPPATTSEIPRFTIGQTFTVKRPGGVALSAGFFGRRGDPLPLFLSEGASRGLQRLASDAVAEPNTSKLQWDAKLGVTAPLWNTPNLKIDGFGEVFLPLSGSSDRPVAMPTSPAFRLGVGMGF